MSNESTEKSIAIISMSIDRELLKLLDEQAEFEGRTRSNMLARMIDLYTTALGPHKVGE